MSQKFEVVWELEKTDGCEEKRKRERERGRGERRRMKEERRRGQRREGD